MTQRRGIFGMPERAIPLALERIRRVQDMQQQGDAALDRTPAEQRTLRAAYEALRQTPLEQFSEAVAAFVAEFGQEALDREMTLGLRRDAQQQGG